MDEKRELDTQELQDARAAAESAFENAQEIRERGDKIAAGWRKSRGDNNFRQMLRALVPTTE